MKPKRLLITTVALSLCIFGQTLFAQTTAFTYQGSLQNGGMPANGNYDFEFKLFDAVSGGTQQGSTQQRLNVVVMSGGFSILLDFSAGAFNGADRYLDIAVRAAGGGAFTPLGPRQKFVSAPYSVKSLNSTTADTATNATQLGGVAANQYVLTSDPRMTDPRTPTAGSANYIQNQNAIPQASTNFNISGNGTAGGVLSGNAVNSASQFNIGGFRVFGVGGNGQPYLYSNTYVGLDSGTANPATGGGIYNSFFGAGSGRLNTNGNENSFFGTLAGSANTVGTGNSYFGDLAGATNTTAGNGSFFGSGAGFANTVGNQNSFFGQQSGNSNTLGSYNSFFGARSGITNVNGFNNTTLGNNADVASSNLSNATAVGASALAGESNALVLGSINGINGATLDSAVGIGTTTPSNLFGSPARFSVLQRASGQWTQHIGTNSFSAGNSFGLLIDAGTNSSDDALRIRNQSGDSQLFSVKGNGLVGIGTGNPNTHLHLFANAPQGFAIQMENANTGKRLYIGNYGTTGAGNHWPGLDSANTSFMFAENSLVFTAPAGIYFSGSTTAEHMRIAPNGYVGIGINPGYKLHVNNTTPNSFAAHIQTSGLATGTSYGLVISAGTDVTDSALQIRDQAGNPLMRVRGNGFVGIGTTNPLYRLHVVETTAGMFGGYLAADYGLRLDGTHVGLLATSATSSLQVGAGVSVAGGLSTDSFSASGAGLINGNAVFNGLVTFNNLPNGGVPICYATGSNFFTQCASSRRFKKNIADFTGGINLIRSLRPVVFDWKSDDRHDIGLIAEEVETLEPLLTTHLKDGQIQGVRYDLIGVVLINAVKEQQEQIEAQQKQIDELKMIVCSLKPEAAVCAPSGK